MTACRTPSPSEFRSSSVGGRDLRPLAGASGAADPAHVVRDEHRQLGRGSA